MANSHIYGRRMKLYGVSADNPGSALADLYALWQTATYLRDINAGVPIKDGNGSPPAREYLFDPSFNSITAEALDEWCSAWQTAPILFSGAFYSSTFVNKQTVMNLFSNLINLDVYTENVFFVTDDDLQYVFCLSLGSTTNATPSAYATSFKKDGTSVQFGSANYINYVVLGTRNRESQRNTMAWSTFNAYDLNASSNGYLSTNTYAASSQTDRLYLGTYTNRSTAAAAFINFQTNFVPEPDTGDDPYSDGGYSGGGGGGGGFDFIGDELPFLGGSDLVLDGSDTGFYTLYRPTALELQNLSGYLWSNNFDLDQFKKLFNNPMDLFLTLNVVPVDPGAGESKEIGFGLVHTGVYMTKAQNRKVTKTFSNLKINNKWNGYLDYAPYVKTELYLPFVGMVTLDTDDVMGNTLDVVYSIDVLTGACIAGVNVTNADNHHYNIGIYSGNAAMQLPITGSDFSTLLTGVFSAVSGAVVGAVTGGGAGAIAGGLASSASSIVNESKPIIQKGGSSTGANAFRGPMYPFIIMSCPKQCIPANHREEIGYPVYRATGDNPRVVKTIGDEPSGFFKASVVNLKNIQATDAELAEIESLLLGGVFI